MNAINNPQAARRVAAPVMDAMQTASARTGIDFDYLVDVARVESGYNPTAKESTPVRVDAYCIASMTGAATRRAAWGLLMAFIIWFRWFSRAVSAFQTQSSCHLRLMAET